MKKGADLTEQKADSSYPISERGRPGTYEVHPDQKPHSLVARLRAGDRAAAAELVDEYYRQAGLEVTGVTAQGRATLELISADLLKGTEDIICSNQGERCAVLKIDRDCQLEPGHYDLVLKHNNSSIRRLHITLSDASHPRSKKFISASDLYF